MSQQKSRFIDRLHNDLCCADLLLCLGLALCLHLSGVTIPVRADEVSGMFTYRVLDDGTVEITGLQPPAGQESIVVPSTLNTRPVTRIGDFAFSDAVQLRELRLPSDTLTSIGENAFHGCVTLGTLTIPDGVVTMAASAVNLCMSLSRLDLGTQVRLIGPPNFDECYRLTAIHVHPDNPLYVSIDGVLLEKAGAVVLRYPPGRTGPYEVPPEVRHIADDAFEYCHSLTRLLVRGGVRTIGRTAFRNCNALTEVTCEAGVTSLGSGLFAGCSSLIQVDFGTGLTAIPDEAFLECMALISVHLPEGLVAIGNQAFGDCISLSMLFLPETIIAIGDNAFEYCRALTALTLPPHLSSLGQSAFAGCSGLSVLRIPDSVPEIKTSTFFDCSSLTEIFLGTGITSIDIEAFKECLALRRIEVAPRNLKYASIDGVVFDKEQSVLLKYPGAKTGGYTIPAPTTRLGLRAFAECVGLTDVVIPDRVVALAPGAFTGCPRLARVSLGAGLMDIPEEAFSECPSLAGITLPASVTTLGASAFRNCRALTQVTFGPHLVSIGRHTFFDCGLQGDLSLPASLVDLGEGAFAGCALLTSVVIPDQVTSFGAGTFEACLQLERVILGAGLLDLPEDIFARCNSLQTIDVSSDNRRFTSLQGVLFDKTGRTLELYPCGRHGTYTIPAGTTRLESASFAQCPGLSGVVFPDSLLVIEQSAFLECAGLTFLSLPDSVTSIESYAFSFCVGLTSVALGSGMASVGTNAFTGCPVLKQVAFFGNAPTQLGAGAFSAATIVYFRGRIGFSSPFWQGYPAVMIDEAAQPAVPWLIVHGYPHQTPIEQDPDGDGVSLLLAYALDLDPLKQPATRLPVPVLDDVHLSLQFHATSPGIVYEVETSDDLARWTTAGVTMSAPGPDHQSTAAITRDAHRRFLRLSVKYE